jgi:hypothetical protein
MIIFAGGVVIYIIDIFVKLGAYSMSLEAKGSLYSNYSNTVTRELMLFVRACTI